MSGRRLLDAMALLGPVRNIAVKHFQIRLGQVDTYTKTSSIFKAIRSQGPTPLAVAAQSFSQSISQAARSSTPVEPIPTTPASSSDSHSVDGVKQDHFYKRPTDNASIDPIPDQDLDVRQNQAARQPLPDGTIPPEDSPIGEERGNLESYNTRPSSEGGQHPTDGDAGHIDVHGSNQSTIPDPSIQKPLSSREARIAQRQSEDQIPGRTADPPSSEDFAAEFSVEQEQDVFYQPPDSTSPVLSALPRMRVPKTENDVQAGDSHVKSDINADVYYSGNKEAEQGNHESELSEEQLSQIFASSRIARMLGGKKGKYVPDGIGSKAFHTSAFQRQRSEEAEKEDLKKLAADMAKDVDSGAVGIC